MIKGVVVEIERLDAFETLCVDLGGLRGELSGIGWSLDWDMSQELIQQLVGVSTDAFLCLQLLEDLGLGDAREEELHVGRVWSLAPITSAELVSHVSEQIKHSLEPEDFLFTACDRGWVVINFFEAGLIDKFLDEEAFEFLRHGGLINSFIAIDEDSELPSEVRNPLHCH